MQTFRARDMVRDEAAIRQLEHEYDLAWNVGDVRAMVSCFTEDAVVVSPRGDVATGRVELVRIFGAFLRGPALGSTHRSRIDAVRFVTDSVAAVDGEATLSWPDRVGRAQAPLVHRFTDILIRQAMGWRIAQVRAYVWMDQGDD